jgi:LmbE family N-acetylglucosaminyl deacetylase
MIDESPPQKTAAATLSFRSGGALLSGGVQQTSVKTTLLVAAHPDDEVIGAGARLGELGSLIIVHITDGAPKNMADAKRHGFSSREQYAQARRREMHAALAVARVAARTLDFRIADQEASQHMAEAARRLAMTIREIRPDLILTHSYEGGHPDHDACAFAVHAAVRLLAPATFPLWEFTSYHSSDVGMETGEFFGEAVGVTTVRLSPQEQAAKRRMLDCFRTQQDMLALFSTTTERYRPAPAYDFAQPPHEGPLFYELHDWGMTGQRFRELAAAAMREIGLRSGD